MHVAQQFTAAIQNGAVAGGDSGVPEDFDAQLAEKNEQIHDLQSRVDELEGAVADRDQRIQELQSEVDRLGASRSTSMKLNRSRNVWKL